MRRGLTFALTLFLVLGTQSGIWAQRSAPKGADWVVLDATQELMEAWHDLWDDGSHAGAKLELTSGQATVVGTETDRNYGVVYQYFDWDLDRYPFLEINVASTNTEWYMIIENPNLDNGFIKLEPGTRDTGKRAYDVRTVTGMHGTRHIRIELGVTTAERPGNKGLSFRIASLKMTSGARAKLMNALVQKAPSQKETNETQQLGWRNRWPDGGGSGAHLTKVSNDKLKLVGDYEAQDYGCVYKEVTIDFKEYPRLEASVTGLTAPMYIIFEGSQFRGGYYRVKPVITSSGNYVYDLAEDMAYLDGPQSFVLKLGVTTDNPTIPVKNKSVEFYSVRFMGKQRIKLMAGAVPSQLITPPPPLVVPQDYNTSPLTGEYWEKRESLDKGGIIDLYGARNLAKPAAAVADVPRFSVNANRLVIANRYYELDLDKDTGAIEAIFDKANNSQVSLGSENPFLWRAMFKDGAFLSGQDVISDPNGKFSYTWSEASKTLRLNYQKPGTTVGVRFGFSSFNTFDLAAEVKNGEAKPMIELSIPRLCFDFRKLDRFYLPWGMGVAFNQRFFKGKRQWKAAYPQLFSDFAHWSLKDGGQCSVYLFWADQPVASTKLNVGYSPVKGETGVFGHGWTTYIEPQKTWKSQALRVSLGEKVEASLQRYRRDNQLSQAPSLEAKLGHDLFQKLAHGVLLKVALDMNRDFATVRDFLKELPEGTLVHYVTWWLEGFDKHMPDYWPVDPSYGTDEDFKQNIALAKRSGLVTMPYTNPTFWNESPTLSATGGPNAVASRNLNNDPIFELYPSGGKGWATSPRHPAVVKNSAMVAKKFFKEYGINILFLDQIGARFIYHDLNPTLGSPTDYTEAWLENCREYAKLGPLFTEQGYDRLVPVMSAFCGLMSFTFPESQDYNTWWGPGSWEYFPMAQYLSHENMLFYHHNLAHEVFCDSPKKIAFYLAHGYNMYNGRWISQWANQRRWFNLADKVQKLIVSRYVGKPLLNYSQPDPNRLYWTAFPNLGILTNISETTSQDVLNHTIAPNGFLATNANGSFLAGRFTRLFGFELAEPQFLVIERDDRRIRVTQLEHERSLVTVPRPARWELDEAITVRQGDLTMPLVATTPQTITFFADGEATTSGSLTYEIEYNARYQPTYTVRVVARELFAAPNTQLKVGLEAQNLSGQMLQEAQLSLSAWLIKRNAPQIPLGAGYQTLPPDKLLKTRVAKLFAGGKVMSAEFPLQIPSTAEVGDIVWLKGELVHQRDKQVNAIAGQSIVRVVAPFDLSLATKQPVESAGEWTKVIVNMTSHFTSPVKGTLNLELPAGWDGKTEKEVTLAPGEAQQVTFSVLPPAVETKATYTLSASFKVNQNVTLSAPKVVEVSPVWRVFAVEGPRVLVRGKHSTAVLRLIAYGDKSSQGTVLLRPSGGLQLDQKEMVYNVPDGGEQVLKFGLLPQGGGEQTLTIEVRGENGRKTLTVKYPVIEVGQARLELGNLLNRGDQDVVLANGEIEVQAIRDLGGRILAFYNRENGVNALYQNYPKTQKSDQDRDWVEYGGINDWFPTGWPGYVWNNSFEVKALSSPGASEASVKLSSLTKNGLLLERIMTLPAQGRTLKLTYRVTNQADVARKYQIFTHPDLSPGPDNFAGEQHQIIVPVSDPAAPGQVKVLTDKFVGKIGKDEYTPQEGWAVALNQKTKDYFLQKFDPKLVTKVGVWQDANFFTMELLGREMTIDPGKTQEMTISYTIGNKNWRDDR